MFLISIQEKGLCLVISIASLARVCTVARGKRNPTVHTPYLVGVGVVKWDELTLVRTNERPNAPSGSAVCTDSLCSAVW